MTAELDSTRRRRTGDGATRPARSLPASCHRSASYADRIAQHSQVHWARLILRVLLEADRIARPPLVSSPHSALSDRAPGRSKKMPPAPPYPVQAGLPHPMHFRGLTLGASSHLYRIPVSVALSSHAELTWAPKNIQVDWTNSKVDLMTIFEMCCSQRGKMATRLSSWRCGLRRVGPRSVPGSCSFLACC